MNRRKVAVVAFATAVIASVPAVAAETVVEMTNRLNYMPETVTISAGDTVRWDNTSDLVHTVTADPAKASDRAHVRLPDGAEPFDSGSIQARGSYSHTFTVPGEYTYFCIPHEAAGMIGNIVVE
ncbi:plastocyanin/azurin family copper-binding protein [Caenispirillum salinarum]|uniref:cupredoxin domain-containing protein n=1 Tax=Caenispirillum salinarum TaxID=859058 RepID=UPI00385087F2